MIGVELFTDWHTWAEAEPELRSLVPPATGDAVGQAVSFAVRWHGDQRRPTGAPYLEHLLEALEVLVAAVLHDVVEDTGCTVAEVRESFGDEVASLVEWATIPDAPDAGTAADRKSVKEAYLAGLVAAPDNAVLVKLADRASNVQTLRNLGPSKQREYYAQTVKYIMPLAASRAWFAQWYASWQEAHRDLA